MNYYYDMALLFPQSLRYGATNPGTQLLTDVFNPENYTSSTNDYQLPKCYSNNPSMQAGGDCTVFNPVADGISMPGLTPPILPVGNPYQDALGIGSFTTPTLPQYYSSFFGNGGGGGGSGGTSVSSSLANTKSCSTSITSNAYNGVPAEPTPCQSGASNAALGNIIPLSYNSEANGIIPTYKQNPIGETLNSVIRGYILVPYSYTGSVSQSYALVSVSESHSLIQGRKPQTPIPTYACPAFSSFAPHSSTTSNYYYSYAQVDAIPSSMLAQVQSGPTYLVWNNASFYQPSLYDNGTDLPAAVQFQVATDRIFGTVYQNSTLGYDTNMQVVQNSLTILNYKLMQHTQPGGYPGYEDINSIDTGTPPASQPQTLWPGSISPTDRWPLINVLTYAAGLNDIFNFTIPANAFNVVNLFGNYQGFQYLDPFSLIYKSSTYTPSRCTIGPCAPQLIYGYQRIIEVFNDKFNNTFYAPIDADIANITVVGINATPAVNPTNANLTTIKVNGTVGFTNVLGNFIPLQCSNCIYIYYDTNLDYADYNPSTSSCTTGVGSSTSCTPNSVLDVLCALGTNGNPGEIYTVPPDCALEDPASATSPGPSHPLYKYAETPTYSPQFNSIGQCSPPPNSLLLQPAFNCNIYGNDGKKNIPAICGNGADGQRQYCSPIFANGTGICTSQMGLANVVSTSSNGYYSAVITACGYGTARIWSQYYGTPPPEPIGVFQVNAISLAYINHGPSRNPYVPYNTFPEYNYYWTPNATGTSIEIGEFLLSYGDITLIGAVAAAAIITALAILSLRRSGKRKGRDRRSGRRR